MEATAENYRAPSNRQLRVDSVLKLEAMYKNSSKSLRFSHFYLKLFGVAWILAINAAIKVANVLD